MPTIRTRYAFAAGLSIALSCAGTSAQADDADNTLKIGYASIGFNTKSGDLSGPPGTTPPGIQADLKDAQTLALIYERRISGPWSVVVQMGTPPVLKIDGAGTGASIGEVGTTRAWFPAVLAKYTFTGLSGFQPYVGAGVNYAFFTDKHVSAAYTGAFSGTSSSSKVESSWGPVVKLGVEFPIAKNWVIDMGYSRYWIKTTSTITTATPGVGDIARTINVKADPGAFGLVVGYRF